MCPLENCFAVLAAGKGKWSTGYTRCYHSYNNGHNDDQAAATDFAFFHRGFQGIFDHTE